MKNQPAHKTRHTGIVVAAGKGLRFGADTPKQYQLLAGKPLIAHCLKTMEESFLDEILLVVAEGDEEYCRENIIEPFGFRKVGAILPGGKERCHSVANALFHATKLEHIPDYVYIQDGARPFLSASLLERLRDEALTTKASVAASKVTDTIKTGDLRGFVTGNPVRESLFAVQTPQVFEFDGILSAYESLLSEDTPPRVTDDVEVYQRYTGRSVKLVVSDSCNMKITTQRDLIIAEALIDNASEIML